MSSFLLASAVTFGNRYRKSEIRLCWLGLEERGKKRLQNWGARMKRLQGGDGELFVYAHARKFLDCVLPKAIHPPSRGLGSSSRPDKVQCVSSNVIDGCIRKATSRGTSITLRAQHPGTKAILDSAGREAKRKSCSISRRNYKGRCACMLRCLFVLTRRLPSIGVAVAIRPRSEWRYY